jgi:hypothetical protein
LRGGTIPCPFGGGLGADGRGPGILFGLGATGFGSACAKPLDFFGAGGFLAITSFSF